MFQSYQDIFAQRADQYHSAMLDCPTARDEEFANAIALLDIQPGATVCDVPAGGGYLDAYVHQHTDLVFVETSSYFASRCPRESHHHVVEGQLEKLPLRTESVDALLSLAAMHHVLDKQETLGEFARVVMPGGRLVIADVEEGTNTGRFLNEFVDRYNSMGHDGKFMDAGFFRGFDKAGLQLDLVDRPQLRWRFPDTDRMASFCKNLFGLDRASLSDVLSGIESILGYEESPDAVFMNWQLTYTMAHKVRE